MELLQAVIAYWRDCVKAESALEQSFGVDTHAFALHERSKARFFSGKSDPFIFAPTEGAYTLKKGKTHDQIFRASLKGQDIYFGYPILMFFERATGQNHIAPLFTIRLDAASNSDGLTLSRGEPAPTLGSCAFAKLGLSPEEIVTLNNEVMSIFDQNKSSKLEVILYLLKKHTKLTFVEGIDPTNLSTASKVHPYDGTVVYNKAILSVGDASAFNIHLLNDLEEMAKRRNMNDSALNYLTTNEDKPTKDNIAIPILPFAFDEYHLQAIQHIVKTDHSVITGPPGTGKSQFIANLIINLFLQKKRVLFVSHTGEAVRVVNERINSEFMNLVMQTGSKELRQDLGRRLEEMVGQYNAQQIQPSTAPAVETLNENWKAIRRRTAYLKQTNELQEKLKSSSIKRAEFTATPKLLQYIQSYGSKAKIRWLSWRLSNRLSNHSILTEIETRKSRHIEVSRDYVRSTYLNLILNNGLYGDLTAYIDAVQNKKFATGSPVSGSTDTYVKAALRAMNIWSCTLKSLGASFPLEAGLFDYVIFDEASQIDLPSAAPALYRAKCSVVVGDENQLNHIAKLNTKAEERLAKKHGLPGNAFYPGLVRYTDTSLFLSAKKALRRPELELKNHYRSNAHIANLFSNIFYGGRLRIIESPADLPADMKTGVYWLDAKGSAYKHKAGSRYNTYEATYIVKLLEKLLPMSRSKDLTIGITTPYTKQQSIIRDKIAATFEEEALGHVQVLTVHKFQGSEVDILIFSPVVADKGDGGSDYWYVHNKQILNVAMSRAKHLLLIVGDQQFALHSESKLKDIAGYCLQTEEEQAVRKIPNRPMNIFEKQLFDILKGIVPESYSLEPQHVIAGRFTVDFALLSKRKNIAIELDGSQHEIIGGLPVFEDKQRDAFLEKSGWIVVRIQLHNLKLKPEQIIAQIQQATT